METVLFDFSFRAPASAKFKLRKRKKIKKKERFGAGTKPINQVKDFTDFLI